MCLESLFGGDIEAGMGEGGGGLNSVKAEKIIHGEFSQSFVYVRSLHGNLQGLFM